MKLFYLIIFISLIICCVIYNEKKKQKKTENYFIDNSASSSIPDYLYNSIFYSNDGKCTRIFKTIFPQTSTEVDYEIVMQNMAKARTIPYYNYADNNNNYGRSIINPMNRDQALCGSCYAFSTIAIVESLMYTQGFLNFGQSLSVQQIVDCTSHEICSVNKPSKGCNGGNISNIAAAIFNIPYKICYEDNYPYDDKQTKADPKPDDIKKSIHKYTFIDICPQNTKCPVNFVTLPPMELITIQGNTKANFDEYLMGVLYTYGPLELTFYGGQNKNFQTYKSSYWDPDIYRYDNNRPPDFPADGIDHAMVLTGWGTKVSSSWGAKKTEDYWIVKNSYGNLWGKGGYIWFPRGLGINYFNRGPDLCTFYGLALERPSCNTLSASIDKIEPVIYIKDNGKTKIVIKAYIPGDKDPKIEYNLKLTMKSIMIDGNIIPYGVPISRYVDNNWNILDSGQIAIDNPKNFYKKNINRYSQKGEVPEFQHTGDWEQDRWFFIEKEFSVPSTTNGCLWNINVNIENKKYNSQMINKSFMIDWNLKILVTEIMLRKSIIYVNILERITDNFFAKYSTLDSTDYQTISFPFNAIVKPNEGKYTPGLPLEIGQYIFKINDLISLEGFYSSGIGNPKISN